MASRKPRICVISGSDSDLGGLEPVARALARRGAAVRWIGIGPANRKPPPAPRQNELSWTAANSPPSVPQSTAAHADSAGLPTLMRHSRKPLSAHWSLRLPPIQQSAMP